MIERLYGVPGAEQLHSDPAAVYESEIDPWLGEDKRERWEIEEWSTNPPIHHVPSAEWIVERVVDHICEDGETDEHGADEWFKRQSDPDVIAAAEHLRVVLASKITYVMADKHLRSLWVTFDAAGEPLLDGEPMYVKADAANG